MHNYSGPVRVDLRYTGEYPVGTFRVTQYLGTDMNRQDRASIGSRVTSIVLRPTTLVTYPDTGEWVTQSINITWENPAWCESDTFTCDPLHTFSYVVYGVK